MSSLSRYDRHTGDRRRTAKNETALESGKVVEKKGAAVDIKHVRLTAAKIEFQAKSDPAFLKRLKDDPIAVLQAEGLDYSVAQDFASQLRGDVVAARASHCPDSLCDPLTCIVTACCWFTTVEPQEPNA